MRRPNFSNKVDGMVSDYPLSATDSSENGTYILGINGSSQEGT